MSPDLLELKAASSRAQMNQTWRVIRERIPESPALPSKTVDGTPTSRRPSWLQIAVAGLAVAVLPPATRSQKPTPWPIARDLQPRTAQSTAAGHPHHRVVPAE
jgi:hypothetical protein